MCVWWRRAVKSDWCWVTAEVDSWEGAASFSPSVAFIEQNLSPPCCGEQCAKIKNKKNLGSPTPSSSWCVNSDNSIIRYQHVNHTNKYKNSYRPGVGPKEVLFFFFSRIIFFFNRLPLLCKLCWTLANSLFSKDMPWGSFEEVLFHGTCHWIIHWWLITQHLT